MKVKIFTILILGFLMACKKDEPTPDTTDYLTKMLGSYTFKQTCTIIGKEDNVTTIVKSAVSGEIIMKNFGNLGSNWDVKGTVTGKSITIADQTVDPNGKVSISGSGTYDSNNNSITMDFTFKVPNSIYTCSSVGTK